MRRRDFVTAVGVGGAAALQGQTPVSPKGRLRQSVTRGVFGPRVPFEDMCREAARLGAKGFDLIPARDWPTLNKYGLIPAMAPASGVTIADGLNNRANHDAIEKSMRAALDECAAGGCPNLVTFSGSRRGMPDPEGADHCVALLNRVKAHAEDKGVTICLELLNSKVDHKDTMCDHAVWIVDVCKRVNSPRVKMLYDIYHAQIMEGDVCRTIKDNFQWIAHFHTGGVPGRHEIDDTQELNYRRVMQAIADLGFGGFVAQEFVPKREPVASMRQAYEICNV